MRKKKFYSLFEVLFLYFFFDYKVSYYSHRIHVYQFVYCIPRRYLYLLTESGTLNFWEDIHLSKLNNFKLFHFSN